MPTSKYCASTKALDAFLVTAATKKEAHSAPIMEAFTTWTSLEHAPVAIGETATFGVASFRMIGRLCGLRDPTVC
jgi:hypothetical protein